MIMFDCMKAEFNFKFKKTKITKFLIKAYHD